MQKTKRLMSLLLAAMLIIGLVPAMVFADDAEDGEMHTMLISPAPSATEEVYVSIAVQGSLVNDKDGKTVAARKITISDRNGDGMFDIDEVLYAAHEEFYEGGAAAGYASAMTDYGLSLVTLWGDSSGSVGYMVSDNSPWNLGGEVKAGDHVYAYVYADQTYWSDAYSNFDSYVLAAKIGAKKELTLSYNSYDENWNLVANPLAGAAVSVSGIPGTYTTDAEGKVTINFDKAGTYVLTATAEGKTLVPPVCVVTVNKTGFSDVEDSKYAAAIEWAVSADPQVTQGYADGTFRPEGGCTRGQVVTFIWRACGCPEPETTVNPFTDVSESSPYYKAILWAVENGITKGTTATTFEPGTPCNRAHAITFLWRAKGCPAPVSTNHSATSGSFYGDAVYWAVENGITSETPDTFGPTTPCARGLAVDFIYKSIAQ